MTRTQPAADRSAAPLPTSLPTPGVVGYDETLLALMLVASTTSELKVPYLGVGLHNLVIPLIALLLVHRHRRHLAELCAGRAALLAALAALAGWALLVSVGAAEPSLSLRYWLKAMVWAAGGVGAAALVADSRRHARAWRVLFAFFTGLAVLGVVEAMAPASPLFGLFRSDGSLSIYPRVASILAWPNQYGVLMAVTAVVGQSVAGRGLLGPRAALVVAGLALTQVAQSGSRNAWLVLAAGLALAVVRGHLSPRRGLVVGAVFVAVVLILPVSFRQTGLFTGQARAPAAFILADELAASTSLSHPSLSLSLRRQLWHEAVREIRAHPVAGIGLDHFQRFVGVRVMGRPGYNAHNLGLNLAAELGLVGLALAVVAALLLVRARAPGNHLATTALAMIVASQVIDCFAYDSAFMTVTAVVVASLLAPEPRQ